MSKVRAHLVISGKVQGVFFRYTMEEVAHRYKVTGWVKNRWDGKVEAVLEGEEKDVEGVIGWSYHGPSAAVVRDVEVKWEEYRGEFSSFTIK